jgi:hypothetical protein
MVACYAAWQGCTIVASKGNREWGARTTFRGRTTETAVASRNLVLILMNRALAPAVGLTMSATLERVGVIRCSRWRKEDSALYYDGCIRCVDWRFSFWDDGHF